MSERVNFFPYQEPALEPGKYTVKVSQSNNINGCVIEDAVFDFAICGDQLSINPAVVYSTYPPKMSAGNYHNCLPHIVLDRRTLPWEKRLFSNEKDRSLPWLALLVFSEDEDVFVKEGIYKNATGTEDHIFKPKLNRRFRTDDESCRFIDISYNLFNDVLPYKEDLKYLAHIRKVSLDDKVTDTAVKNGWFSCVIANRYPKESESEEKPLRHLAYLVSLEGFADFLEKREAASVDNKEYVRMFVLTYWEFMCQKNSFDFYGNAKRMEAGVFMPEIKTENPLIKKLTALGYCPVDHIMREGSKTVSWYHPPIVPKRPQEEKISSNHFADELLKYDSDTGMFDITYQSAWQMGRFLGLSDKKFTGELIRWRYNNVQEAAKKQLVRIISQNVQNNGESGTDIDIIIKSKWESMAKSLISDCGQGDPTNLEGTGLPDFSAENLEMYKNVKMTQEDLVKLYQREVK